MYSLNPRLAADLFDGEYIIANLDTGLYYSVQGLAVSLIKALPFQDQAQLIGLLTEAFPQNSELIEKDINAILRELLDEEIIVKDSNVVTETNLAFVPPVEYVPSRLNRYADMQDLLMLDPIHDVDEEGWTVQDDNEKK